MARNIFSKTVTHDLLGKSRVITGTDYFIVQEKAYAQYKSWDMAWERLEDARQAKEEKRLEQQERLLQKETKKLQEQDRKQDLIDEAAFDTEQAALAIEEVKNLLAHTLRVDDTVNWTALKKTGTFQATEHAPEQPQDTRHKIRPEPPAPTRQEFDKPPEEPPGLLPMPEKPTYKAATYAPQLGFFAGLVTPQKKKENAARMAWLQALEDWKKDCLATEEKNFQLRKNWLKNHRERVQLFYEEAVRIWQESIPVIQQENTSILAAYEESMRLWQNEMAAYTQRQTGLRIAFEQEQSQHNAKITAHQKSYEDGDADAAYDYFDLVLSASQYPENFPREWEMQYQQDVQTLLLNYRLPSLENMPRLKEVRYLPTKDERKEYFYTEAQTRALYDSALYQIVLRTVHELFESDYANALQAVVFNGIVHGIDSATGHDYQACVMSLQASKEEFLAINLTQVEPKACFKTLKGVGSSQLHSMTPVAPIQQMETGDSRFVQSYGVAQTLDEGTNLASMDWEDFEHLIRELFEAEFRRAGGEVRITRASRDGGVDAVVFDPDPIRGGKIVIQAKRYANTVGVAAVRDLYGTTLNEGANKGILVSTANYGPDAYDFAKNKPLTLLNGANLLHLLNKHGHRAFIDLNAAKAM